MMKIMKVRLLVKRGDPGQPVSGMVHLSAQACAAHPHAHKCDVGTQERETGRERHEVGDEELHRVRIERCKRIWGSELVVLLVEAWVEGLGVESPVGIEEEHLIDREMRHKHPQPLEVGRQRAVCAHAHREARVPGKVDLPEEVWQCHDRQIEGRDKAHARQFGGIDRLAGLDLERGHGRACGGPQINGQENQALHKVGDEEAEVREGPKRESGTPFLECAKLGLCSAHQSGPRGVINAVDTDDDRPRQRRVAHHREPCNEDAARREGLEGVCDAGAQHRLPAGLQGLLDRGGAGDGAVRAVGAGKGTEVDMGRREEQQRNGDGCGDVEDVVHDMQTPGAAVGLCW
mmetsp:Transcript_22553/g.37901  ORF Transcript_22553/g.37901 Transcript_22553/m.37901 type:complete len:346 (-) Transcript_22553:70-1107(-)